MKASQVDRREFYDPNELAQVLGRSRMTVYRHLRKHNIPAYRLGRRWYIRKSDLVLLKV